MAYRRPPPSIIPSQSGRYVPTTSPVMIHAKDMLKSIDTKMERGMFTVRDYANHVNVGERLTAFEAQETYREAVIRAVVGSLKNHPPKGFEEGWTERIDAVLDSLKG